MADLLTIADFVGAIDLQVDNNTEETVEVYIEDYTRDHVRQLLGQELGDLFLTNYDDNAGVPTGVYATIWEPFTLEYCGKEYRSKGMQFYLSRLLWFFYSRDNNVRVTIGGNKSKASQNSTTNSDNFYLTKNWNDGILTGQVIQQYIEQNLTDYPTYNGQELEYLIGL